MSLFAQLDVSAAKVSSSATNYEGKEGPRQFRPGQYEIKVTEVCAPLPSRQDPSWNSYLIKFTDVEGSRKGSTKLLVPTTTLEFVGDAKGMNESRLRRMLQALGFKATNDTIASDLEKTFGNVEKGLVGKRLNVKLDFRAHHSVWDKELNAHTLVDKSGNAVRDAGSSEPITFGSSQEAEAFSKSKNWYYSGFVDVTSFIASEPKVVSTKTGFGVKK
jgi:hypothetical protein